MLLDTDQLATRTMDRRHVGVLVGQHLASGSLTRILPVGHLGTLLVGSEAPTMLRPRWPA
jgi:hypothetical protein